MKWIDLFNTNFLSYMRYEDHVDLCKQNRKQIVIVQELNPAIIKNWESVSIAAAAFECTFMRYWLDNNNLEFDVIENFERHSTKVVLHIPSIDNFKWSKYKKNKHVDILNQYHNYVDSKVNSAPLVIRNNDELRTLADEIRVSHNVHGINLENRKEITNVSLETALVPDPLLKNFYKKTIGLSDNKITKAFSSYLFYQVVMRTAIRDDIEINVFALDVDTICRFIDFFDNVEAIEEIDVSYVTKPAGRPKTTDEQKKATKREYMKKYMANKRKNRHSVKC